MKTIKNLLPDVKTSTLRERPLLPIGVKEGGEVARDIAVRPWRLQEERELGELRSEARDANTSQYAAIVLAAMCTRLGPWQFSDIELPSRRVHISGLTMPDVFFAYIYLRVKAMGPGFKLVITCSRCEHEFPLVVNLEDVEVRYVDDPEQVYWEYDLASPLVIREKEISKFRMGPTRWGSMEQTPAGLLNLGVAKSQILNGSLYGFPGADDMVLAEHELDQLSKRDIEALTVLIDETSLGPDMSVEDKCPRCKGKVRESIDWSYETFFGTSSQ